MIVKLQQRREFILHTLLGLLITSLFFGQALTHLLFLFSLIAVLVLRPKLLWINPFAWLILFYCWEFISDYLGPYNGQGMESGGIGYHFLLILLPLSIQFIDYKKIFFYIAFGAVPSAILMWFQSIYGVAVDANFLHLKWGEAATYDFSRARGFNKRLWIPSFIHSLVLVFFSLSIFNKKFISHWLILIALFTGVVLPQTRAMIIALVVVCGFVLFFGRKDSYIKFFYKAVIFILISLLLVIALFYLRPGIVHKISMESPRVIIFLTSFDIFKEYPFTGLGGGEYYLDHYKEAFSNRYSGADNIAQKSYGHTHNDFLMLLTHHGWPALLLWLGFIAHSIKFVWQYGDKKERNLFLSLVLFQHVVSLAETYLDYSTTTYAIMLFYGLALHGPVQKYKSKQLI